MAVITPTCEIETQYLWWLIRQLNAAYSVGDSAAAAEYTELLQYRAEWSERLSIRAAAAKALDIVRRTAANRDADVATPLPEALVAI